MNRWFFLLLACLTLFLWSCEKPFDPQIAEEPAQLVINSQFSPNLPILVTLTHSRPILSNEPFETISDANIEIFEDGQPWTTLDFFPLAENQLSSYYTNLNKEPVEGRRYEIRVQADGYPLAIASDEIPLMNYSIQSFNFSHKNAVGDEFFDLEINDQVSDDNFYHVVFNILTYEYLAINTDTMFTFLSQKRTAFALNDFQPGISVEEDSYVVPLSHKEGFLISDNLFSQNQNTFRLQVNAEELLNNEPNKIALAVVVELRSVSESYYEYFRSVAAQSYVQENPLLNPIEVYNNVENGYGNFSSYNSVSSPKIWR